MANKPLTTYYTEVVPFRLIHTECCRTLLCWVNPRLPSYCPECGKRCHPAVKSWVTFSCKGNLRLPENNVAPLIYQRLSDVPTDPSPTD